MAVKRFLVLAAACVLVLSGNAVALLDDTIDETLPDTGSVTDDADGLLDPILPGLGDSTGDEPDVPGGDEPTDDPTKDPSGDFPSKDDDSKVSADLDAGGKDGSGGSLGSKDGSPTKDSSGGAGPDAIKALSTPGSALFVGPVFQDGHASSAGSSDGDGSSTFGRPAARDVPATPGLHFVGLLAALGAAFSMFRARRG